MNDYITTHLQQAETDIREGQLCHCLQVPGIGIPPIQLDRLRVISDRLIPLGQFAVSTTSEVVSGAEKAEDAGEALKRIESVSKDLSALIEEISQEAETQSETATRVAEQMISIRDVSIQTSEGSKQTAKSMGRLADQVHKLSESVADFKLPRVKEPENDA